MKTQCKQSEVKKKQYIKVAHFQKPIKESCNIWCYLGVRLTSFRMKALANNLAVFDDDTAYQRIRTSTPSCSLCQFHAPPHIERIIVFFNSFFLASHGSQNRSFETSLRFMRAFGSYGGETVKWSEVENVAMMIWGYWWRWNRGSGSDWRNRDWETCDLHITSWNRKLRSRRRRWEDLGF